MLSITTDYINDIGNPEQYLRHIAETGFSHIHWCHHWNTDFIYSTHEISHIKSLMTEYSLLLLDLHTSSGNDGHTDQHKLPFTGTIDWNQLSELIRKSVYKKVLNLEVSTINSEITNEQSFLKKAYQIGNDLSEMVNNYSTYTQ